MFPNSNDPTTVREIIVALHAAANAMNENLQMEIGTGRLMRLAADALTRFSLEDRERNG